MLSARVFVFCMFLTVYLNEFFVFLGFHYLLMLFWILSMRSNFCGSIDGKRRKKSELVYNLVMAFVFVFDISNIKEGPTRLKNLFYYTLISVEHAVLMFFWYRKTSSNSAELDSGTHLPWSHDPRYHVASLSVFPSLELVGLVFLVIFYTQVHPNGSLPDMKQTARIV